jgi:hypothetical protein
MASARSLTAAGLPALVALTEEIGSGFVGPTYRGFAIFADGCGQEWCIRVVAKTAFTSDAKEALKHEAAVYESFREAKVNGVPTLLGLFDDLDDSIHVLVTTDVGQSLNNNVEPLLPHQW